MAWKAGLPTRKPKPGWVSVLPVRPIILKPGWIGHQKVWRTAAFSGNGGLVAEAFGRHSTQSVSLSGSGSLLATILIRRFREAGLYGQGTLSAAALGPVFRSVQFSGGGFLTAAAEGPHFVDVDFSGGGELGWDELRYPHFISVEFGGQGLLGADAEATEFQPLPDGLSATTTQRYMALAAFAGSGELTIALSEIEHALGPNFTAAGELSAVVKQIQHVTANLSGGGALQAIAGRLAALQGSGTLSASAFELLVALRDAAMSGGGTMTGSAKEQYPGLAAAGGSGTMSAQVYQIYTIPVDFSGDGGLSAQASKQVSWHILGAGFDYNTNDKTDTAGFNTNCSTGDYVIVALSGDDDSAPTATLGGSNMTKLASIPYNNNSGQAQLEVFGKVATANNQAFSWTGTAAASVVMQSVSYRDFGSLGPVTTAFGASGPAAHNVSCNLGEMIVQIFAANTASWTPGGGTLRSNTSDGGNVPLAIQDSPVSANFVATGTVGNWASVAIVLRP